MGPETVDLLVDKGMIRRSADLYRLRAEELLALDRTGEKSVENLLSSLQRSREQDFERVLFALGIRYVGETVAKKLARHFKHIDRLAAASLCLKSLPLWMRSVRGSQRVCVSSLKTRYSRNS